jgi:hypothetical protein
VRAIILCALRCERKDMHGPVLNSPAARQPSARHWFPNPRVRGRRQRKDPSWEIHAAKCDLIPAAKGICRHTSENIRQSRSLRPVSPASRAAGVELAVRRVFPESFDVRHDSCSFGTCGVQALRIRPRAVDHKHRTKVDTIHNAIVSIVSIQKTRAKAHP